MSYTLSDKLRQKLKDRKVYANSILISIFEKEVIRGEERERERERGNERERERRGGKEREREMKNLIFETTKQLSIKNIQIHPILKKNFSAL